MSKLEAYVSPTRGLLCRDLSCRAVFHPATGNRYADLSEAAMRRNEHELQVHALTWNPIVTGESRTRDAVKKMYFRMGGDRDVQGRAAKA